MYYTGCVERKKKKKMHKIDYFSVEVSPNLYSILKVPEHIPDSQINKYVRETKDKYTRKIIKPYI